MYECAICTEILSSVPNFLSSYAEMTHDKLVERFTCDYQSFPQVRSRKTDVDSKIAARDQAQSSNAKLGGVNDTRDPTLRAISTLKKTLSQQVNNTGTMMGSIKDREIEGLKGRIAALETEGRK